MSRPEHSFTGVYFTAVQFGKQFYIIQLVWLAFFPAILLFSFPGPPILVIRVSIKHAASCNRDIFLFKGIDQWRIVHQFHSFPAGKYHWEVIVWIAAE